MPTRRVLVLYQSKISYRPSPLSSPSNEQAQHICPLTSCQYDREQKALLCDAAGSAEPALRTQVQTPTHSAANTKAGRYLSSARPGRPWLRIPGPVGGLV